MTSLEPFVPHFRITLNIARNLVAIETSRAAMEHFPLTIILPRIITPTMAITAPIALTAILSAGFHFASN
jgi:hypothetical protein